MKMDPLTGILHNVRQVVSPNCDGRPIGVEIDLVVVHNISLPPNEFGGPYIDALFTNTLDSKLHDYFSKIADFKVSAHCLIRRTGDITQYVPFAKRAWHAGLSSFQGRKKCNDFSIGIELEGTDEIPYTPEQYNALVSLLKILKITYPRITFDRIVGHSTVAPDRKTDPGPSFDWELLTQRLNEITE
jgi:AmpD protein